MVISYRRGAIFHKITVSEKSFKNDQFLIKKASKNRSKIDQKSYQNLYQKIHRFSIDFWSKMPPKMEPKTLRSMVPAATLGPQELLKSHTDPFSRKSKPPDLNFIKKVTPDLRKSSLQTSNSSKKWPRNSKINETKMTPKRSNFKKHI